jgi:hypothetical protein
MKFAKFLSLAALSISLSGLVLSPASANSTATNSPNRSGENLIASATNQLGRIIGTSGSTVTVLFRDGSTRDFQVAPEDIQSMNLTEDTYVTVTEERIIGIARSGRIVAVVGDILTYRLNDGTVGNTSSSGHSKFTALDLRPGTFIFISNGEIIAVSSSDQSNIIQRSTNSRTSTLGEGSSQRVTETVIRERQVEIVPTPTERIVEPMPEPVVTEPVIKKPAVIKKPVRGLW